MFNISILNFDKKVLKSTKNYITELKSVLFELEQISSASWLSDLEEGAVCYLLVLEAVT